MGPGILLSWGRGFWSDLLCWRWEVAHNGGVGMIVVYGVVRY